LSTSSELTIVELSQLLANQTRKALTDAMIARGYDGICMPEARLIWEVAASTPNIQQLAERTGTTKQFCAREVAKLREAGYLATEIDPGDKRAVRVGLTEKGENLMRDLREEKLGLEAEMRARVGSDTYDAVLRAMNGLVVDAD
jgi:DNA-binding MarR family transcriptional regulator